MTQSQNIGFDVSWKSNGVRFQPRCHNSITFTIVPGTFIPSLNWYLCFATGDGLISDSFQLQADVIDINDYFKKLVCFKNGLCPFHTTSFTLLFKSLKQKNSFEITFSFRWGGFVVRRESILNWRRAGPWYKLKNVIYWYMIYDHLESNRNFSIIEISAFSICSFFSCFWRLNGYIHLMIGSTHWSSSMTSTWMGSCKDFVCFACTRDRLALNICNILGWRFPTKRLILKFTKDRLGNSLSECYIVLA